MHLFHIPWFNWGRRRKYSLLHSNNLRRLQIMMYCCSTPLSWIQQNLGLHLCNSNAKIYGIPDGLRFLSDLKYHSWCCLGKAFVTIEPVMVWGWGWGGRWRVTFWRWQEVGEGANACRRCCCVGVWLRVWVSCEFWECRLSLVWLYTYSWSLDPMDGFLYQISTGILNVLRDHTIISICPTCYICDRKTREKSPDCTGRFQYRTPYVLGHR